jgi:hypothetical protein
MITLFLSVFSAALLSAVIRSLSLFRVRALKQSRARFFGICKSHAFAAMKFTTWPTARAKTFHENRQLGIQDQDLFLLAGVDAKNIPVRLDAYDRENLPVWSHEDVGRAKFWRQNDEQLPMDASAGGRCQISAEGTRVHGIESASARARRQGTGVLDRLAKRQTLKLEAA